MSRKFSYTKIAEGSHEIVQYLSVLRDGKLPNTAPSEQQEGEVVPNWRAIPTVFGGTHVHIGMDWKDKTDADPWFIRHLAFIVLGNEELISSLHPWRRRGKHNDFSPVDVVFPQAKRRRTSADKREEEELRVAELAEKYIPKYTLRSNIQRFDEKTGARDTFTDNHATNALNRHRLTTWNEIANVCFSNRTSLADLFDTIQARSGSISAHGVLVDFSRLKRFMGYEDHFSKQYEISQYTYPTIEFHQHNCSLNADEIERWVRFLFAIVHLAEQRAHNAPSQLQFAIAATETVIQSERKKHPDAQCRTLKELCGPNMLNLSQDDTDYWIARHNAHQHDNMRYTARQIVRRHRRKDKPKYGLRLTPEQISGLPDEPTRGQYAAKSVAALRSELKEQFNLEAGDDFDKKAVLEINKMSKKQLIKMAMESDTNLRTHGTYTKLPTRRMREQGKRYRMPCSRTMYQYEAVTPRKARQRYAWAGIGWQRELNGLQVWGWDPVKAAEEGLF